MSTDKQREAYKRIRGRKLQDIRAKHFAANPLCAHCLIKGRYTLASELDHIIALTNGGKDIPSNYQALCSSCHKIKTAQDLNHKQKPIIGLDGYPIEST